MVEHLYNIARSGMLHNQGQPSVSVPPWGVYHAAMTDSSTNVMSVAYNPMIMATPSDLSTVYTTLMRAKESINKLGQTHIPIFFDMGRLPKAPEITWAYPEELEGVIPCEGGMHLLMSVLSAIGYIYGDAGLKQLLHESGVFAAGSVQQILAGKDFDRGL